MAHVIKYDHLLNEQQCARMYTYCKGVYILQGCINIAGECIYCTRQREVKMHCNQLSLRKWQLNNVLMCNTALQNHSRQLI